MVRSHLRARNRTLLQTTLNKRGVFLVDWKKTEIEKIREEHTYKVVSWVLEAERTKRNPVLTQRWELQKEAPSPSWGTEQKGKLPEPWSSEKWLCRPTAQTFEKGKASTPATIGFSEGL